MISKVRALFILLISGILFSACKKPATEMVFSNDFEELGNWYWVPTLQIGEGHSGFHYSATDSLNPYSITFSRTIFELGPQQMNGAEYSAWVRVREAGGFFNLVCTVEKEGKNTVHCSQDFRPESGEIGQWVHYQLICDFPPGLDRDSRIKLYVFNSSGKQADVDDVTVRFKY
ncbi:hypothetical protein [Candidatus Pollutiaquabacter sp.]|uniref:hypothetical protein n=1 Tax=Candidatus Pollutiaquabacter sp. TaxID=3416354 RepID=UPI003CA1809A|nr:hypothetical protein [Bacteroidota bacterium]